MTPNRRRFLHFFDLCVPKTLSVSRDGSGNCNQARVLETIHFGGWFNLLSRLLSAARVPQRGYTGRAAEQGDELALSLVEHGASHALGDRKHGATQLSRADHITSAWG